MRRIKRLRAVFAAALAAIASLAAACIVTPPQEALPEADVRVAPYYDTLAPYGTWVTTDEYGWVWIPNQSEVGSDFVPYATGGTWVYTDAGWSFSARWTWGSVPFHYGRWIYMPSYGWVWVPDNVWGPAWVEWRSGGGYVGWAPLPPRPRRQGVIVREHGRHWIYVRSEHMRDHEVILHRLRFGDADKAAGVTKHVAPPHPVRPRKK